jgi:Flp pilus assembly protein CpaB
MKQKNLILMVVAVGCGLLAAFLTSQMSAKPQAAPQLVKVLVVAKELPPGTKFTLDSIKDQFKEKMINPEAIPEKAVTAEDQLDGKTLNKTMRLDDMIREFDLGNYQPLLPPAGKDIITIRLPIDKITPFVQPASRVDIIGTAQNTENKVKAAVLLPNVLVMATDVKVTQPNGGTQGELTTQYVSIAASKEEAIAVRVCEAANVKLSFILRSEGSANNNEFDLQKILQWLNGEDATVKAEKDPQPTPMSTETPKDLLTKIFVPTMHLPAGTELTSETLSTKFKEIQWSGPLPADAVEKIKDHVGRFIVKDIFADLPVAKICLADAMPKAPEPKVAKQGDDASPQVKPEPPKATPVKKLPSFDRTYSLKTGPKTYRYEIQDDKSLKLLGEVGADGTVTPTTDAPAPPPAPEKEEKKDEKNDAAPAPKRVS